METLKTILAIIGLILIGFFAGFFTHREMTMDRIQQIAAMTRGPGFQEQLLDKLEATTQQRQELDPIVQDYGKRLTTLHRESREQRKVVIDSLYNAIRPHLTPQQTVKLEQFSRRFRANPLKRNKRGPRKKRKAENSTDN